MITWFVGYLARWLPGSLVTCLVGYLVRWLPDSLVTWLVGYLARWLHGSLVTCLVGQIYILSVPVCLSLSAPCWPSGKGVSLESGRPGFDSRFAQWTFCLTQSQYTHSKSTITLRWPSGKESASRAEGPGFVSRLRRDFFSGSSYTSDINIGTPMATLPGAWRYRVSTRTVRPGVSIL